MRHLEKTAKFEQLNFKFYFFFFFFLNCQVYFLKLFYFLFTGLFFKNLFFDKHAAGVVSVRIG